MTDTFNHGERRTFEERLARLCGESTYRMPVEGRSTRPKPIPVAHQLAAALAFAREGQGDIGPDIAYDIATGRRGHANRVCRILAEALGKPERGGGSGTYERAVTRNRQWLRASVWAAYDWVVAGTDRPQVQRPLDVSEADWIVLVEAARRILWSLADQALINAERAMAREAA